MNESKRAIETRGRYPFVPDGTITTRTKANGDTEQWQKSNGKWAYIVGSRIYSDKAPHIRARHKYTPEVIEYIQAHWNRDMSGVQIAAQIGFEANTLRMAVKRLRADGYEFAERTRKRTKKQVERFVKAKAKKVAKIKPKKVKTIKSATRTNSGQPRERQTAKRASDSVRQIHHKSRPALCNDSNPNKCQVKEQSGGKWIRLDSKTIVYRKTA